MKLHKAEHLKIINSIYREDEGIVFSFKNRAMSINEICDIIEKDRLEIKIDDNNQFAQFLWHLHKVVKGKNNENPYKRSYSIT